MKRDEHKTAIQSLLGMVSPEHQADASKILTNLSEDYEQVLTTSETAESDLKKANENFEKLRAVNSELFLKVGVTKAETHKEEEPNPTKEEEKILPFSDLFNEKGELI